MALFWFQYSFLPRKNPQYCVEGFVVVVEKTGTVEEQLVFEAEEKGILEGQHDVDASSVELSQDFHFLLHPF